MKWQNNGVAEDEVRERSWGCVRGQLRMTSRECGVHCGSWGTTVVCSIGEDRQEGAGIGRQLLSGPCNQEGVFIRAVAGLCAHRHQAVSSFGGGVEGGGFMSTK